MHRHPIHVFPSLPRKMFLNLRHSPDQFAFSLRISHRQYSLRSGHLLFMHSLQTHSYLSNPEIRGLQNIESDISFPLLLFPPRSEKSVLCYYSNASEFHYFQLKFRPSSSIYIDEKSQRSLSSY